MLQSFKTFMEQPVGIQQVLVIFGALMLLILLSIWMDWKRSEKKGRQFPEKHPGAALVYLYLEGHPAEKGKLNCIKGTVSPLFSIPAIRHPGHEKGLAFYALPGVVTVSAAACQSRKSDGSQDAAGRVSFEAEQDGVYRLQLRPDGIQMTLLKGRQLDFEVQQEPPEDYQYNSRSPVHSEILKDFHLGELRRLLSCSLLMLLPLGYLVWIGSFSAYLLLLPLGLLMVMLGLMFAIGSRGFLHTMDALPLRRQEQIQQEFANPHPIYPLFQGEVHLLSDCLICRHGGRLSLIPLERVISAQGIRYSKTYGLAKSLLLRDSRGKTYQLEFWGKHQKQLKLVSSWIKKHNPNVLEL